MNKPKYLRHYEKKFIELKTFVDSIREINFDSSENMLFKSIVISAFTKCYDYNLYNSQSKEYDTSFYKLATLRSICEELISLSYLLKKPIKDRNEHIKYLRYSGLYRTLVAQSNFFKDKNAGQIVPNQKLIPIEYTKQKAYTCSKLPTIEKMAKETNLESIYDFIYHATSTMVHFNPDVLLKLGWGELDNNSDTVKAKFSVKNYHKYYHAFNTFYSWYLLREQFYAFENYLKIPKKIIKEIEKFDENFIDKNWPELTTFEHLNIKRPSIILEALHRVLAKE